MLEFLRVLADQNIIPPSLGADLLFLDDGGVYKTMDSAGVVRVLGRGIKRIDRTAGDGSEGTDDTYTILFDGGETQTYQVHNGSDGRSIVSIVRTAGDGSEGTTDIYTITYTKAPLTSTFPVYNGKDGRSIISVARTAGNGAPGTIDTYTITYTKEPLTSTFEVYNGRDGLIQSVNGKSQPNIVLTAEDVGAIPVAQKGAANGVATLGSDGKVPAIQLPSYVDDVLEFANLAAFPATGETGKIYVALDTGEAYRWSGSLYIEISRAEVESVSGNDGVQVTTTNRAVTIVNTDKGSVARSAHEAAADPHPQYQTQAEGDARYSQLGHTHTSSQITDFTEAAQDATGAMVEGNTEDGVSVVYDDAANKLNFTNTDKGSAARTAHEAAADPHPQYQTQAETATQINDALAAATADQAPGAIASAGAVGASSQFAREDHTHAGVTSISVNGGAPQQGAVSVTTPAPKLFAGITNLFASAANSAAVQTVTTLTIPANTLTAGKTFRVKARGTQSQSAAATNIVQTVTVNGTTIASLTIAGGTAAQTNRPMRCEVELLYNGSVFYATGSAMVSAVAEVYATNVTGVAAAANAPVTLTFTTQTSTANAANINRYTSAYIAEV